MNFSFLRTFRLLMACVAKDKAWHFPLVPNAETIEAMKAARRGELVTVGSPEELLASLNEDDQILQPLQAQL
jgi:DNA-damage-inducible protein J